MKKFFSVLAAATLLAGAADAQWGRDGRGGRDGGRSGRWSDQRDERFRVARPFDLGWTQVGFNGMVPGVVSVPGHLQCALTHIKLSNNMDSVLISRVDVTYQRPDRFGNFRDSIDLRDDDDYGRGRDRRGRGGNGISLDANESTPWLDLDDVQDGFPNGRCVTSIQIFGIDTPDFGGRGRPGQFGGGRGGFVRPSKPVTVKVEGIAARRGGNHDGGHRPPPPPPVPRVGKISCSSEGGQPNKCYVGQNVRAVDVDYKRSKASCSPVQFNPSVIPNIGSYAFDQRGGYVYVYGGCRATFNVYYH